MSIKQDFAALKVYAFDDGGVIFDRRSGYTYRLDSFTLSVFEAAALVVTDVDMPNTSALLEKVSLVLPSYSSNDIGQALSHLNRVSILSD